MNPVAEEMLATGRVAAPDGSSLTLHSHLPRDECEIVQHWVREHRPRRLLEIGLAYGVSTLAVCEAMVAAGGAERYHVIDPWQHTRWAGAGLYALERAGYRHLVRLHEEPSELVLPRMLAGGTGLDFALVDGWHGFDQVMMEVYYLNRMLAPGGVLVLDDVHLPGLGWIAALIGTWPAYRRLEAPVAQRRSRPARVRRMMGAPEFRVAGFLKTGPDQRSWDFWVDPP